MLKKSAVMALGLVTLLFSFSAYADPAASLLRNPSDPVVGDPKAATSVVQFFDYRCSHCVNEAPIVDRIINANPEVRFVFKELPVFGAPSELGARAALAANKQGKYYPFHSALMARTSKLDDNLIIKIATKLGLDIAKFKTDMNSAAVTAEIKAVYALAKEIGVKGTPAFYIGKTDSKNVNDLKILMGEVSQTQLSKAINS